MHNAASADHPSSTCVVHDAADPATLGEQLVHAALGRACPHPAREDVAVDELATGAEARGLEQAMRVLEHCHHRGHFREMAHGWDASVSAWDAPDRLAAWDQPGRAQPGLDARAARGARARRL